MIHRHHSADGIHSEAVYSACGSYRYSLSRRWGAGAGLVWVMLNPSTATEERNDPTIERCQRRAAALGLPGFAVVNLFAFRATRPADLRAAAAPVGPENDRLLLQAARDAALILCGWGTHGAHLGRGAQVEALLRQAGLPLHHLGLTREGHPRHPLYVGYATGPQPW